MFDQHVPVPLIEIIKSLQGGHVRSLCHPSRLAGHGVVEDGKGDVPRDDAGIPGTQPI